MSLSFVRLQFYIPLYSEPWNDFGQITLLLPSSLLLAYVLCWLNLSQLKLASEHLNCLDRLVMA